MSMGNLPPVVSPEEWLAARKESIRNTTLAAVSRAPYAKIAAYRERMGWTFPWYSSYGSDVNYDLHATVDDRVAPVQIFHRNQAEMAAAGTPWSESMLAEEDLENFFLNVKNSCA